MKKLLRVLGVLVGSVALLYWGGVNALLASPWGEAVFNQRPKFVQIHFSRAWTIIPLQLELRDFRLSMQDPWVQLAITADRVRGNLHPWTLGDLHFLATQVEADGVTLRVRPRLEQREMAMAHLDQLPAIEGFDSPLAEQSAEEAMKRALFLVLDFQDLTVHHLREVWIDRIRYSGDAEVTGGMMYEPFRKLRIDDGHFTDTKSTLVVVAPHELAFERLDARVTLGEVDLRGLEVASLRGLVADVKLAAIADPHFLNSYLSSVRGLATLSLSGADGPLDVDLQIADGVVADGAKLSYQSSRVAVRLPLVEVSGAASVVGTSTKGRLALAVDIAHATLRQRDGEPLANADRFLFDAASPADLTQILEVDAALTLRGGEVKTLTTLNQFIPEGAGVRFAGGQGLLEGSLRLDAMPARARGKLTLTANDVVVKNRSASVTGDLLVQGVLKSLNLDTGVADLSGSTVAINDATIQAGGSTWSHLWLRLVAEPCLLTPQGKVLWTTDLSLGSSNLQPLLAIVSAHAPLPRVLGLLTNSPNVKVEASVVVREDGVDLPRLVFTSQNLRAEGALSLREVGGADPRLEPWGHVLAHAGVLRAGLELEGPKLTVVLLDLDRWATERKLLPEAPAPPAR